jgi:hypothetical protein
LNTFFQKLTEVYNAVSTVRTGNSYRKLHKVAAIAVQWQKRVMGNPLAKMASCQKWMMRSPKKMNTAS